MMNKKSRALYKAFHLVVTVTTVAPAAVENEMSHEFPIKTPDLSTNLNLS